VSDPSVSALILNYNYGRFLSDALRSVVAQTFADVEILVADDGSTDDSAEVCRRFEDRQVRFVSGPHVGLGRNLQRGLDACMGTHIAFLSADDMWLPRHLELCIDALAQDGQAAVAYSSCQPVDEAGEVILRPPSARKARVLPSGRIAAEDLLPSQFIPTQAAVVKGEALRDIGGIDATLHYTELDLFLRLTARYRVVYTGATTVLYRQHGDSMSRDHEQALTARLALYRKHLSPSPTRRRLVAHAHAKTAYRQLRTAREPGSVRHARRNIVIALRVRPRAALQPLNIAILGASLMGPAWLPVRSFYERHLTASRFKLAIQKLLSLDR
jgi:glycosyltransferase involved in cell wall biosynthesis